MFDSLFRKSQETKLKMNVSIKLASAIRYQGSNDIDDAIRDLLKLLDLYTIDKRWFEWAEIHNNLGVAYMYKLNGIISENIENGISHWRESLKFFSREDYPFQWGQIQTNIGGAYLQKGKSGDRSINLEKCIEHSNLALGVLKYESSPRDWGRAQNNLAVAYFYRITGNKSENIETSILHYELALKPRSFEAGPVEWAMSKSNLGGAYLARIKGEEAQNIEEAIKLLNESLQVRTRDDLPTYWAETQALLGTAYAKRIFGDRKNNLQVALKHYQQSLEVYDQERDQTRWSEVQENLALVHKDLSRYSYSIEDLDLAIAYLENSLQIYMREESLENWVSAKINSGDIYRSRFSYTKSESDLLNSEKNYQQAIEVISRDERPESWARAHGGLGETYLAKKDLTNAISNYKMALEVFSPNNFPKESFQTSEQLGNLYYFQNDYRSAREFFTIAHEAIESMRSEIQRESTKRELAGKNVEVYERLVYCCLLEGDVLAALEYVFAAKSRVFLDQLVSTRLDLSTTAANNSAFSIDIKRVYSLRHQIDRLLDLLINKKDDQNQQQQKEIRAEVMEEIFQLQKQEEELWSQLEQKYPLLTATQKAPTVSAKDAMNLAKELDATIIEYYQHAKGWCAFVITAQEVKVCPLDKMNDDFPDTMLRWINDLDIPAGRGKLSYKNLQQLYLILLAPLSLSDKVKQLILAPFGVLHLFPFAAALNADTNHYLSEDFALSFAPSSAALCISKKQLEVLDLAISKRPRESMLSVAYPGVVENDLYLPNVLPEAKAIAKYFPQVTALYEGDATPQNVIANASGKQLIHFGCHGSFDIEHPQQSGLVLSDGWLTVQRIVSELRLDETEIVTIGACLSGKLNIASGDELMGLTQSMLTAGAKAVVGSLWSVNDPATRALFESFYYHVAIGEAPVVAIQKAMQSVRKQPDWAHPYYWAAFSVNGLAYSKALERAVSLLPPVENKSMK
ncbi:MAG: hypothetical protein KPEEDBHJ_00189 [Anaerolineales bacterium]|nr:hypothetical protein [Anaerolineales bacterium]